MRVEDRDRDLLPMSPSAPLEPAFSFLSRSPPDAVGAGDPDDVLPPSWDQPAAAPLFQPGARVLASARRLGDGDLDRDSSCDPTRFARPAAYRSLDPGITGNYRDLPKCNVFAGDVLYAAGYAAPTHPLPGGGRHYDEAERWPRDTRLFDKVTADQVRPGDLLVVDYHHRHGPGGAHLEVVTRVEEGGQRITTMGARAAGLAEDQSFGRRLTRGNPAGDHVVFHAPGDLGDCDIYVLRPKPIAPAALASNLRG
jgi:hypothetical protein